MTDNKSDQKYMSLKHVSKGSSQVEAVARSLREGENAEFPELADNPRIPTTPQYSQVANKVLQQSLDQLGMVGTNPMSMEQNKKVMRSNMEQSVTPDNADDLPLGPGYNYMTHLFRHHNVKDKIKDKMQKKMSNGANIFTDQLEAIKAAIEAMGILSDKNPSGLPIDIREAKKIVFGDKDIDGLDEAQWRGRVEQGDSKVDPKKVRKFVNPDGSITWEILNDDKTVMSRFTMGEHAGTKIFAQGGIKKFSELLKQLRAKVGDDAAGEFDSLRSSLGG